MKKRNKPIVLTTALILLVGVVAFMNFPKDALAHGPGDGHGHDEGPQTGQDIEVPNKEEIAKNVSDSIKGADPVKSARPLPPGEQGAGPAIAVKKPAPYKPMPNDSSTSTQWYTDSTPKEIPKK